MGGIQHRLPAAEKRNQRRRLRLRFGADFLAGAARRFWLDLR